MKTKVVREELNGMFKRTAKKRKIMKSQVCDTECAKTINQNFKDLECVVYSTIK